MTSMGAIRLSRHGSRVRQPGFTSGTLDDLDEVRPTRASIAARLLGGVADDVQAKLTRLLPDVVDELHRGGSGPRGKRRGRAGMRASFATFLSRMERYGHEAEGSRTGLLK